MHTIMSEVVRDLLHQGFSRRTIGELPVTAAEWGVIAKTGARKFGMTIDVRENDTSVIATQRPTRHLPATDGIPSC